MNCDLLNAKFPTLEAPVPDSSYTGNNTETFSKKFIIAGFSVVIAIFLVIVLIFTVRKRRRSNNRRGNDFVVI